MIIKIGADSQNDYVVDDRYVSRYHAQLLSDKEGTLFLEDLNSTNGTFVNGDRIIKKRVTSSDLIKLGDHYLLNVADVLKFDNDYSEEFYALKEVYGNYIQAKIRIQSLNQFKTRLLQTIPFAMIGVAGLVISLLGKRSKPVFIVSIIVAIIVPVVGVYFAARQSAKIPALLQQLANQFKIDYVCPKCGTFLGDIPWESLANKKRCSTPGCHAKWVRS